MKFILGIIGGIIITVVGGMLLNMVSDATKHVPTIDALVYVLPFVDPARPRGTLEHKLADQLQRAMTSKEFAKDLAAVSGDNPNDDIIAKAQEYDRLKDMNDVGCAYTAFITNNTERPAKQLKFAGKNIVGFTALHEPDPKLYAPEKKVETTLAPTMVIPALDPTDTIKVIIYTSSTCTYDGAFGDDLHFFTDDQSVKITFVTLANQPDHSSGVSEPGSCQT